MEPKHLSFFLKKHKLPTPKKHFKLAIDKFLGTENAVTDVSFKNGTLHVKARPAVKQEIFLKEKEITAFLMKQGLGVSISKIL